MGLKDLLSLVPVYVGLQRAIGADRLRYRCIEESQIAPGETVLDVGCGPAYYFDKLPQPLVYHGYDTEPRYIDWARQKWGDKGVFHLGGFDKSEAERLPPVDAILLLGLLHHLSDAESDSVLSLCAGVLAPDGRVIAVDTCFEDTQSRLSRWMSENDRGEYVRTPEAFLDLARARFRDVEGTSLSGLTRVPGGYWMMRMANPSTVS